MHAEAARRGLGAVQLRKPGKLGKLVARVAAGSELPLTVKIRTGPAEDDINVHRVRAASCPHWAPTPAAAQPSNLNSCGRTC